VLDDDGRAIRVEEPAEIVASANGFGVSVGEVVSRKEQMVLAASLADSLFELIKGKTLSPLTQKLLQTDPLVYDGRMDIVFFSGGVSEYVYGYEKRDFGDIGILLGEEIRKRLCDLKVPVGEPAERIRATVIGESQYTLQVSGTTNLISDFALLPIRNLPVVAPKFASSVLSVEQMEAEIIRAIGMHDLDPGKDPFALAFARSVINQPSYRQMKGLADAVASVQKLKLENNCPLILVFEADIGMGIGRVIQEEVAPNCALISIDEVKLSDFNYVDIGEPTGDRGFIPVIIKSLVF
jgi:ethanolamine utilization protein EutA